MTRPSEPCPCGGGRTLAACCLPFLRRAALPDTAEALMRSRYTAFALGDADHLWRTWHPRTRPETIELDARVVWTGLRVLSTSDGGPQDETGEVSFAARFESPDGPGTLREHSRFERRGGRWFYLERDRDRDG